MNNRLCAMCDTWYDERDWIQNRIHQHPEPQSGPIRMAWLNSKLDYETWIRTTDEGKKWLDYVSKS